MSEEKKDELVEQVERLEEQLAEEIEPTAEATEAQAEVQAEAVAEANVDTGISCLVMAAQLFGIPCEENQMKRAYVVTSAGIDIYNLIRAARDLGLKAGLHRPSMDSFANLPLPAIIPLQNGRYCVMVKWEPDGRIFIIDPLYETPLVVTVKMFFAAWKGEMIMLSRRHNLKIDEEKKKKFGLSWFAPVVWKYRAIFFQVFAMSLLLQLFGLVTPFLMQNIIDKVLVHRSLGTLDILLIAILCVNVFQSWITGLRGYIFTSTTNKIDVVLSSRLFRHITSLPLSFFSKWQVGDVTSRVGELKHIRDFLTGSSLTVVLDVIFAVVYIAVMLKYSVMLTAVTIGVVLLFVLLSVTITPIFRAWQRDCFTVDSENQSFMIETITGMQTLKALAVEQRFVQKRDDLLARYIQSFFRVVKLKNIAGSLGSILQQGFNLALLWVGARLVLDGKLTLGELIAFQMMSGQVLEPMLRLVGMWQSFQQTVVSLERLGDILDSRGEPEFDPNRTTLPAVRGNIIFDRVVFRYTKETAEILRQVSLKIEAGMSIGIVGRSGSGKSTLAKLVQRLYVPESGRVLIDGVDLAQVEPAWLRRQIGVVQQENLLFTGSVRQNIAIAKQDATIQEILQAALLAGAHDFIMEMSEGYDTVIGERGMGLSGGQRQRIAIARALILDPSILIFDEATSALDYESERVIMDNIGRISEGRTMILIAHRLSTIRHCDMIVVMEQGVVAEWGTHEELLAQQGLYWQQHEQQV